MTLAAIVLNPLLMILLPIGLAIGVRRATGARFRLFLGGALAFLGSQVVHMPILWGWSAATNARVLPVLGSTGDAVVLGALAALCEEPARAILFWRVFPADRGRDAGLAIGAGHGGVEAVIFGVLALISTVNIVAMSSMTEADLVALGTPAEVAAQAIAQVQAALGGPWYDPLAGAFERAMTVPFHVACSLLVAAAFRRKSAVPFVVAIVLHATSDTLAVLAVGAHLGTWGTELVLAAFVVPVTVVVWIWAFRAEPRLTSAA
jgi:uncharacterized membrane protein YhfC